MKTDVYLSMKANIRGNTVDCTDYVYRYEHILFVLSDETYSVLKWHFMCGLSAQYN